MDTPNFEHGKSLINIAIVLADLKGKCECQPYEDVFTFEGWKKQGYHVAKGQKSCSKISTFKNVQKADEDGTVKHYSFPKTSYLFCRCQVEKNTTK